MNNDRDTYAELRGQIDSNDPFMTGGHQILKERQIDRKVPEWALNDGKVQEILLRSFPRLTTDALHRARAGKWARVIYMYFREKRTHGQIAKEMKLSLNNIKMTVRSIKWAASGKRANGSGVLKSLQCQEK